MIHQWLPLWYLTTDADLVLNTTAKSWIISGETHKISVGNVTNSFSATWCQARGEIWSKFVLNRKKKNKIKTKQKLWNDLSIEIYVKEKRRAYKDFVKLRLGKVALN